MLLIVLYCSYLVKEKQTSHDFISNYHSNPRKYRLELHYIKWLLKICDACEPELLISFNLQFTKWKVISVVLLLYLELEEEDFCSVFGTSIYFVNKDMSR